MGSKLLIGGYITALISLFIGIFALIFSRPIIQKYITTKLRLTPGSQLYDEWLNPSFQIYMNFYLFDLMNGDEFLKGAKPTFKEVGPFVFHEYITKEDLVDNRNYTISYKERRRYEFVPEMSQHNLDYEITSLNMAVVTVISKIRHSPGWMHDAVNLAFDVTGDNSFLVKKPVKDILFGYEDNFLKELKKIVPSLVPSEIVGLFTDRNNTIYANWTIYTGYDDYKKTGAVEKYNHMETLKFWSTPYANMINGSDGSVLSPFLDRYGLIYSFQKDLCRSIYGKPAEKTVKYTDDIELMTFSPDAYFFANVSVNPDNAGFCTPPGNCLAAGLLNLTSCLDGIPIIMTSPHFLFCDPKFEKEVEGITPDESKHSTVVYVEQNTGVLMKANKRIQFNSQLIRDARISCAKDIPEILYPLFWVDENFAYNKTQADHFYAQVTLPLNLVYVGKYLISSIGLVLILASIAFHVYLNKTRSRSMQPIDIPPTINNSDDDERTPLINHTS